MSTARGYRSPDGAARALARLLREDAAQRVSREPALDAERERVLRAARLGAPHGWRARRGALALALAAALALLVGGALFRRAHGALQFSVDGAARPDGTTVVSTADRGSALRFSDGSEFDVEPASRLRVESTSATGSRLSLLAGKTVAHVVHREKSSWALDAGPFEVQVTGTRFDASWDATRQRLIVELYEGSVQVVGRSLSAPIAVRTGQRLEAGASAGDWLLSSLSPPEAGPATPGAAEHDAVEPAGSASSPDAPGPEPKRAARAGFDWPTLVQRADFDGIVREAEDYGLERCLSGCAPADLRILADAARYSGRAALAERSLLALRKRAPAEAATAAFLLARLNEERARTSEALRWYEQHLQEAPASPYAAEALAGKMRLLQRSAGAAAARATAELYLARFPNGVQANAARRIVADAARP